MDVTVPETADVPLTATVPVIVDVPVPLVVVSVPLTGMADWSDAITTGAENAMVRWPITDDGSLGKVTPGR